MTQPPEPIVVEAMKKAQIIWVSVADARPRVLWCAWIEDACHVVCGGAEQADPGFETETDCRVISRGDHGGRVVEFAARAVEVSSGAPEWESVSQALAGKRLNSSGDTARRWARESQIYRLEPLPTPPVAGEALPSESLAAPPPGSPAARTTRKPYRLHKVGKRR